MEGAKEDTKPKRQYIRRKLPSSNKELESLSPTTKQQEVKKQSVTPLKEQQQQEEPDQIDSCVVK